MSYLTALVGRVPGVAKAATHRADVVAVAGAVEKLALTRGNRWYNTITPDDTTTILLLKPENCSVYVNTADGQFRVHHKHLAGSRMCISWGKRGYEKATAEALVQMWSWEHYHSGAPCPLPAEMLELAAR